MGSRWKCKLCKRKHGSGKCWRQAAMRKKLRRQFPDMKKTEIAKMARDLLLEKQARKDDLTDQRFAGGGSVGRNAQPSPGATAGHLSLLELDRFDILIVDDERRVAKIEFAGVSPEDDPEEFREYTQRHISRDFDAVIVKAGTYRVGDEVTE